MAKIKDLLKMCECYDDCEKCELYDGYGSCGVCDLPDNADEIVDKWAKEHPVKTYAMDFFEKFPNAPKDRVGGPKTCVKDIYGIDINCSEIDCVDCWNQEMKENG